MEGVMEAVLYWSMKHYLGTALGGIFLLIVAFVCLLIFTDELSGGRGLVRLKRFLIAWGSRVSYWIFGTIFTAWSLWVFINLYKSGECELWFLITSFILAAAIVYLIFLFLDGEKFKFTVNRAVSAGTMFSFSISLFYGFHLSFILSAGIALIAILSFIFNFVEKKIGKFFPSKELETIRN